ncbi:hypothetical protein D3C81_1607490 [compost metagenome]
MDNNSVMKPRRSRPAITQKAPATRAIRLATAMALCGSLAAYCTTTARIGAASAESGPSTRMRLGPNRA